MTTKAELTRAEDAGWAELLQICESLSPEQLEAPGYSEDGWSVKDLIGHIAAWQAEAGRVLEQIRGGTYDAGPVDVDATNRRFYEANRDLPLPLVRAELWSSRTRMLSELNSLSEITPAAREWFVESGAEHYREHLPRLRDWARELGS